MQLSVEVKRQEGRDVLFCRGRLLQGQASEYLFQLLTRSTRHDVVVDLEELLTCDEAGLQAFALSRAVLASCHRQLLIIHASEDMLEHLRERYRAAESDLQSLRPLAFAGNAD